MVRNLLILPDGREVFSGAPGETAIREVTLTQQVNSGTELMPGAVCAAMLEVSLITPTPITVGAGEEVTLFHVLEDGTRRQVGIFRTEQPERTGRYGYKLLCYDRVTALDKDLTGWLASLTGWPYTLKTFAAMVCAACGVTLTDSNILNSTLPLQAFSAQGITGRQLMAWVGQLGGRFCRATATGELELAWYTAGDVTVAPGGAAYYFQNGLQLADYRTAKVEKVQVQLTGEDVGAIYPDSTEATNTLKLTGNYLLTGQSASNLKRVASVLYNLTKNITYTPGTVTVPASLAVQPGQIITLTDAQGVSSTFYVMQRVQTGQRAVLTATGSPRRDSVLAVNSARYEALSGKVLNLRMDVDGLQVEARRTEGALNQSIAQVQASISLEADKIVQQVLKGYVEAGDLDSFKTSVGSQLRQLSDQIDIQFSKTVTQLQENTDQLQSQLNTITKHITFTMDGMTIGASDSPYKVAIDNDIYEMTYNGQQIFCVKDGVVYTPQMKVDKGLLLLGYQASQDENGMVNWDYIGKEEGL